MFTQVSVWNNNQSGEVTSSWVIKGAVDFLLSISPEAQELRKRYVFRIVPMLNPDGVIYGNYRCSLLGYDLNRQWKSPDRYLQPTVYYAKRTIRFMRLERKISLFCDFHSHSMQENVFMYGCSCDGTNNEAIIKNSNAKIIPLLMSQLNSNFSFKYSDFIMEKCKEGTARIVLFKKFNVINSYTCEASFFGYYSLIIVWEIPQLNMKK